MKKSLEMIKLIKVLKNHNVSAYEIVGYLTGELEQKLDDHDYEDEKEFKKDHALLKELYKMSWEFTQQG